MRVPMLHDEQFHVSEHEFLALEYEGVAGLMLPTQSPLPLCDSFMDEHAELKSEPYTITWTPKSPMGSAGGGAVVMVVVCVGCTRINGRKNIT